MSRTEYNAYNEIGGFETVERLVTAFYKRVSEHPTLIPLFPNDFKETARKQKQFLTQFLGGPPLYTEEFGHPMLRKRHLRFPIGNKEREAWLSCMSGAMEEIKLPEPWRELIFQRLSLTAHHMMNQDDLNMRGG
ncbi:globin [Pullulanibacillus sp. KACC 23026]|uniref:globin domain-containing protein n=1 Tax=Pullulanibacillus sp. KACC 23026 TaxID=3028315 RepID=UPI0023B1B446|nr:globin [Pullulanibacillus sp. KACC 23026]WEG11913.1 globin [Pullulanibacillus sp. KACC 23026]